MAEITSALASIEAKMSFDNTSESTHLRQYVQSDALKMSEAFFKAY